MIINFIIYGLESVSLVNITTIQYYLQEGRTYREGLEEIFFPILKN